MRQILRNWRAVFKRAQETAEPIIILSNNEPQAALISLQTLEKWKLMAEASQAQKEHEQGRTVVVNTGVDLEDHLKKIDTAV